MMFNNVLFLLSFKFSNYKRKLLSYVYRNQDTDIFSSAFKIVLKNFYLDRRRHGKKSLTVGSKMLQFTLLTDFCTI